MSPTSASPTAMARNTRLLTFDQESNWYPALLNDGRVLYTRYEYANVSHQFGRFALSHEPGRHGPDGVLRQQFVLAEFRLLCAAHPESSHHGGWSRVRASRSEPHRSAGPIRPGARPARDIRRRADDSGIRKSRSSELWKTRSTETTGRNSCIPGR